MVSQLATHSTTSSKTLMGQASKGKSMTVQVEDYDAIQLYKERKPLQKEGRKREKKNILCATLSYNQN